MIRLSFNYNLCLLIIVFFVNTFAYAASQYRIVTLDEGAVKGEKYWNGDYYEFYGVPYARVPEGKQRFQGPLPPEKWQDVLEAKDTTVVCPQQHFTDDDSEIIVIGDEDCLVMNLLVPAIADEDNLVPVLVYIHSGAFSIGHGNIATYQYLARHDVIVVSFNYRLGTVGFACLGTKEIPGNAGMKDQVAALRWINKNIKKFGGDANKVTVAGFSVGAAMAELLSLSKTTEGLIDKIILESGSALSPWAINRDPVTTAKNYAMILGYNKTESQESLVEFYINASADNLATRSLNFFWENGTFGFAPCIENVHDGIEPFLTESPRDIFKNEKGNKVAVLTGFANMEGLSRINMFDTWSERMEMRFADFLPTDLAFTEKGDKEKLAKDLKAYYFKDEEITHNALGGFVDFFSDTMFKYSIAKSMRLRAAFSKRPVYAYEFSYVGTLNAKHNYMDLISGASHRDQTSYILDFHTWTNNARDLDTRDRMTMMWTDFVLYEDPTAYESPLIDFKWHKYSLENPHFLHINTTLEMRRDLFEDGFQFYDKIYERYYFNPLPPKP